MPKVSVIIPVYNGERYLRQCLDSVCAQTLRDIEILVVDDGSTDGTADILRTYAQKDGRVRVLTQPNINAGAARNHGMRHATGEYYSFLDADDFFEPDMLERAVARAEETQAQVVLFDSDVFLQETMTFAPASAHPNWGAFPTDKNVFAADEIHNLFSSLVGWPWDKLFLASYIRQIDIRFQEQRTTNDLLFVYAAIARADRIAELQTVLVHYRRGVGDSLSATREKSWFCFYTALLGLRAKLMEWNLFDRYEQDFVNYCVIFSRWQLQTLAQPVHDILIYMLGKAWFEQLGVTNREEEFFYDPESAAFFREVMDSADRVLANREESTRVLSRFQKKIRGGIVCIREHGFFYTLRLICIRLKKEQQ